MQWNVVQAIHQCHYKAWLLSKEECSEKVILQNREIIFPFNKVSAADKIALTAWYKAQILNSIKIRSIQITFADTQKLSLKLSSYTAKAEKLLTTANTIISQSDPPVFYKNKYCHECHYWNECYLKLKERDCISLLGGISPKAISRYHGKGIFSITQLSYLFRPRRRGRRLPEGKCLWELKALALREKKIFVLQKPEFPQSNIAVYLDFEGLPDENFYYLIGAIIKEAGLEDKAFSFWCDNKENEQEQFQKLFKILNNYPEAPIYHYGSYELSALKKINKKTSIVSSANLSAIEKRMINLLSYLRTNVYAPTYGNGLKEVANLLGFSWNDESASGVKSIGWRKEWEHSHSVDRKDKLQQYNYDDCQALIKVHHWLETLSVDQGMENVLQVAQMRKYTPYNLQNNKDYSEDFQLISKAAYFDYQHAKIYWRNKHTVTAKKQLEKHFGRGHAVWQPKKVNEIIQLPALKKCPYCGHTKLYHAAKQRTFKQTDLKFTSSGIKQWVIEYHAGKGKCAKCLLKYNDSVLQCMHLGDNLFAWATNMYVNYRISFAMISRMLQEQFGIWTNPTYFNDRNYKWWRQFKPEVDYCWQIVFNSPVIHIDETPIRLAKGKDKGYVWTFATSHTVFYQLTLTREVGFLHEKLRDYKGVIVTDFFPGYETLPVQKQKCLIHLIRDLNDDLFKNPFDEEFKSLVVAFGNLLKKIIGTIDKYGLKTFHLKKHIKDTLIFYKKFVEIKLKSDLSIQYAKRLKKHWPEMWTFLNYDGLSWNNNNAEAAIKGFVQHRRTVNGQVSENGLTEYLSMLTIAQTCRYRNISFLDYLRRKKGIWQNVHACILPPYLPFAQARLFTRLLKLKKMSVWNERISSNKLPLFIPPDPHVYYNETGWKDWDDWLN